MHNEPTKKNTIRGKMRKAMASGNNDKAAKLSSRFTKQGGNADKANARITKGLVAKDTRKQLKTAIKSGNKKAVRGATRAVRATNTSEKRKGVAMRIKKKTGYQGGNAPRKAAASRTNTKSVKRTIPYDNYPAKQKPSKVGSSRIRSAGSALGSHEKSRDSLIADIGANRKKSSYK